MGPIGKAYSEIHNCFSSFNDSYRKDRHSRIFENKFSLQTTHSNTCGLQCLHMAHYLMRLGDQHSVKLGTFHTQFVTLFEPLRQVQEIDLVLHGIITVKRW